MEMYQFFTLVGILGAGFGWMIVQQFSLKSEISDIKTDGLETKVEILKEIRGLDARISHMEGYLIGIGQKTGTQP
jgi:hypothetical protein